MSSDLLGNHCGLLSFNVFTLQLNNKKKKKKKIVYAACLLVDCSIIQRINTLNLRIKYTCYGFIYIDIWIRFVMSVVEIFDCACTLQIYWKLKVSVRYFNCYRGASPLPPPPQLVICVSFEFFMKKQTSVLDLNF